MKTDLTRHETLCYELAKKFELQAVLLLDITSSIEALKTYPLVNDLHMEAYQPLQVAAIAYEVTKGLVTQK